MASHDEDVEVVVFWMLFGFPVKNVRLVSLSTVTMVRVVKVSRNPASSLKNSSWRINSEADKAAGVVALWDDGADGLGWAVDNDCAQTGGKPGAGGECITVFDLIEVACVEGFFTAGVGELHVGTSRKCDDGGCAAVGVRALPGGEFEEIGLTIIV